MPEYRAIKETHASLELFTHPELMIRIALEAQQILGVDAAILFTDLLPILIPAGLRLDYRPGIGPQIANPVRTPADVDKLRPVVAAESMSYIETAVTGTRTGLPADIPLIGFVGAPFTLASYAIEGQGSRNYLLVKKFMYDAPSAWHRLLDLITDAAISSMHLQIDAGVQAMQVFDSWVGCLSLSDFRQYALSHTRRLLEAAGDVPVVHFSTGHAHLLADIRKLEPDCVALDWRVPLKDTWEQLGCRAIQGNLDPALLCAEWPSVREKARTLLDEVAARPGHIFNLGHGVLPQTPVDNVKRLVDFVHDYSSRQRSHAAAPFDAP